MPTNFVVHEGSLQHLASGKEYIVEKKSTVELDLGSVCTEDNEKTNQIVKLGVRDVHIGIYDLPSFRELDLFTVGKFAEDDKVMRDDELLENDESQINLLTR
jgi:hypothetical protein